MKPIVIDIRDLPEVKRDLGLTILGGSWKPGDRVPTLEATREEGRKMDTDKIEVIKRARAWVARSPVLYLDTETTGLGPQDQICQLAVVDDGGRVVVSTLIRPTIQIPAEATQIHGIKDEDVRGAPSWAEIRAHVLGLLSGRLVLIYNAGYDLAMLKQTERARGFQSTNGITFEPDCVMLAYAQFYGDWNDYRGSYRWQRLSDALNFEDISTAGIAAHSAAGDCEMTRRLVHHMAGTQLPEEV